MSATPWTPGPWRVEIDPEDTGYPWFVKSKQPNADWWVAAIYDGTPNDALVNARLIAAAPEMAESLEELQGELSDLLDSCLIVGTSTRHMDRLNKLENNARALLTRIRGETP